MDDFVSHFHSGSPWCFLFQLLPERKRKRSARCLFSMEWESIPIMEATFTSTVRDTRRRRQRPFLLFPSWCWQRRPLFREALRFFRKRIPSLRRVSQRCRRFDGSSLVARFFPGRKATESPLSLRLWKIRGFGRHFHCRADLLFGGSLSCPVGRKVFSSPGVSSPGMGNAGKPDRIPGE